jgi:hypothetical protein
MDACWLLAWVLFSPEEGGSMFLQNIGQHIDNSAILETALVRLSEFRHERCILSAIEIFLILKLSL